ncbi:hypothetical protein cand_008510 [Cryptosporidium andersoni]|uniref:R3H domain-containing protein n=1 Tax=Cryptosporidium andersoni TaxID=117008 RepID=A0A1J4MP66_9CRYT|nr:hypothetical protein cand_008510 [Cryptosporidium andersoni]
MLGNRKYRRWLNNQLLLHKGNSLYVDEYDNEEEANLIFSGSSFHDHNHTIYSSTWIKLRSNTDLYELYLKCGEDIQMKCNTYQYTYLDSLNKNKQIYLDPIAFKLHKSIDEIILLNDINNYQIYEKDIFQLTDNNSKNIYTKKSILNEKYKDLIHGFLYRTFESTFKLLDQIYIQFFISSLENHLIEYINGLYKGENDSIHYFNINNSQLCNTTLEDKNDCNDYFLLKNYITRNKYCKVMVIQNCNKLFRKLIHCVCKVYLLNSTSIGLDSTNKFVCIHPFKSLDPYIPKISIINILKIQISNFLS